MNDLLPGEEWVIKNFIKDGDTVFDVGAFQGEWIVYPSEEIVKSKLRK